MQYFGGKQRISKYIVEVLNDYRKDKQPLVEPFVGGCNVISKMDGERYCYDINEYLIEMYKAVQNGWIPPTTITKEEYDYIKNNKDEDKVLTGFVGVGCSYSGKWFGGYAKNNTGRNYCMNAHNSIMKQVDEIKGIEFACKDYRELNCEDCLIYCDPPYKNTTKYSIIGSFDTEEFWQKMRELSKKNTVIISEYEAPADFECIKEIRTKTDIRNGEGKREDRVESYYYQCILSIGNNKVDKLKEIIKEHHFSCYPHTKSVHRVVFSSMKLVNFIIDNGFGRSAESKKIPQLILNLPVDKLKSFLDGYMSSDGCEIDGKYQATTVSKELAMSLCLVIQKVYRVGCRIYFDKRPDKCEIQGRIVNQKDTYMVQFMKESQKQAWFIENNIVWYPVKEITDLNKQEDVYNIEVKEDHTYTANNMIVYNCQDFSVAGKQKGSVWTCKDCGHEYNPLTVHWSKRDECPNCGSKNIDKTRSSLLVEYLRVIRANKPNFVVIMLATIVECEHDDDELKIESFEDMVNLNWFKWLAEVVKEESNTEVIYKCPTYYDGRNKSYVPYYDTTWDENDSIEYIFTDGDSNIMNDEIKFKERVKDIIYNPSVIIEDKENEY